MREKKWHIQDKEAGNVIASFNSLEDAEKALQDYEEEDKSEGTFVENFYEIVATFEEM